MTDKEKAAFLALIAKLPKKDRVFIMKMCGTLLEKRAAEKEPTPV